MGKKIVKNAPLFLLIIAGLFYRLCGLGANYSFWTDENHVAIFARAILERGKPVLVNGYHTGAYQWLLYWFMAFSMKIFGINEFAARFPSVVFGVLTIFVIYLLGKRVFGKKVGIIAAFLIAFLNIEILFSRQARPYQILQFFYVLGAYFVVQISNFKFQISNKLQITKKSENQELRKQEIRNWIKFLGCGIIASLFHGLGIVIFFNGLLYILTTNLNLLRKKWRWVIPLVLSLLVFSYIFKVQLFSVFSQIGKIDNLFYYRVLLTHNYLPLTLLAGLGGLFLLKKQAHKKLLLFAIFLGTQSFIVSFLLSQPFTRYFYPIFPFIILLASYGLIELSQLFSSLVSQSIFQPRRHVGANFPISLIFLLILVFTITLQNKIAIVPQKMYSLNADMQEIPEVDWKKIYHFVNEKLDKNPKAILVVNWNDLPIWYLGENTNNLYLAREKGNRKYNVDPVSGAKMIYSLRELENLIKENPIGIAVFDSWDNYILDGAREYAQKNFKKELEIDRLYPIQPRYWPVSVYSWGME